MSEVRWGTKVTRKLTMRMACRVKLLLDNINESGLAKFRVLNVALARKSSSNSIYVPQWLEELDIDTYDDTWRDWQPGEIQVMRDRLRAGYDPEDIQAVFRPPERLFENVQVASGASITGQEGAVEEFSEKEIGDDELREYANQEWRNYASRVDLSQPTNRSAVRSLIILDIQLRRLDERMLNPNIKVGDLTKLHKDYSNLRQMYSDAAEDVAQLERQRENRDIAYTFSQLIERTREISRQWEATKMPLHHQLEESALIQNMVLQHKVDLRPVERIVERTGDLTAGHVEGAKVDELTEPIPDDVVTSVLK